MRRVSRLVALSLICIMLLAGDQHALAGEWRSEYTFAGTSESTATGRDPVNITWATGLFMTPQAHQIGVGPISQGPTQVSISAKSKGDITVKLTWFRAPNDMNDKPPAKTMVKLSGRVTWRGDAPPVGMSSTFNLSGTLKNGLGSPTISSGSGTNRNGSCYGVKVITLIGGSSLLPGFDYDRDAPDPITVTLDPVSVEASMTGSSTDAMLSGSANYSQGPELIASIVPVHAHPVNFWADKRF